MDHRRCQPAKPVPEQPPAGKTRPKIRGWEQSMPEDPARAGQGVGEWGSLGGKIGSRKSVAYKIPPTRSSIPAHQENFSPRLQSCRPEMSPSSARPSSHTKSMTDRPKFLQQILRTIVARICKKWSRGMGAADPSAAPDWWRCSARLWTACQARGQAILRPSLVPPLTPLIPRV